MPPAPAQAPAPASSLRRDLGTLESYAALLGILIGAGIFKVTGQAWTLTGPSVILGYAVLALAILAICLAYTVYLSTPLGLEPGGEYLHISRTFSGYESEPPYQLVRWSVDKGKETILRGPTGLTYWKLNRPGAEKHLKELGLPVQARQ